MAVVDDDFADIADCAGMDEIECGMVAAVPGSFVIDENVNFCGASGTGDGLRVFVRNSQRLFHHDRNRIVGAKFDDFAVIVSGSVDEDSLWVSSAKEFVKVRVIERRIKMEFRGVLIEERVVGLGPRPGLAFDLGVEKVAPLKVRLRRK